MKERDDKFPLSTEEGVKKMKSFQIIFGLVIFTLFGCIAFAHLKKKTANDNEAYLKSFAEIIVSFQEEKGALPASLEEALSSLGKKLPHRGDINGRPISYYKIDGRSFIIRSVGANHRDEKGLGDDVQINLIDGELVSRKEILEYVKSRHPDEWGVYSIILDDSVP